MKSIASTFDLPPVRTRVAVLTGLLILLFVMPSPVFPKSTIDGEWVLAVEWAARNGLMFGRDFVFTYGPLGFLATGLFAPQSFAWVLLAGIAIGLCWLSPLMASRRPYLLALYALAISAATAIFTFDIRSVSALLACSLLGMIRPSRWSVAAAAGWGIIALSKLSFVLVALPLMILIDLHGVMAWRRLPFHVIGFASTFLIGLTVSGTPPEWWAEAARNDGSIIAAYSSSMQLVMKLGGAVAMLAMLAMLVLVTAYLGWLIWSQRRALRRPVVEMLFPFLAIVWSLWMSFKMGFGRADEHMIITWATLAMTIPAVLGSLEVRQPLTQRQRMAAPILMLLAVAGTLGITAKTLAAPPVVTPARVIRMHVDDLMNRPAAALSWLMPVTWHEAIATRTTAENNIRRRFAIKDGTTADIIPQRLGPVILSNLAYHPRPIPQSYSAFTPLLQQLDARHFASTDAPQILFMDIYSEIDERLPTLSTGPSLPVIAQWYDVVGTDPLGAVLRRRATARPVRRSSLPTHLVGLGQWLALPRSHDTTMTTVRIVLPRSVLAGMTGLLAREPIMFIELRRADQAIDRYRFVPGMAEAGVVLSPMVRNPTWRSTIPDRAIGLVAPGSRPNVTIPVTAIRLVGDPLAARAYADAAIRFDTWDFGAGKSSPVR